MSERRCRSARADGTPCSGTPLPGGALCFAHAPEHAEAIRAARSRAAAKANRLRAIEGRRRRLDNPRALAAFVSTLIHDALEGKVEADLARSIGYLVAVQTKVIEQARQSDVEQALAEVRALVAEARRRGA